MLMTVAFVHGNPETDAIWDALIGHLDRKDVVKLSPPGFGAPVPRGFNATSDDYLAWLVGEVKAFPAPVDLVGHDWGGGHVLRLAMSRPDLIRSWVSDIAGAMDPGYVWHDMAQVWQTPEAGEKAVAEMIAAPMEARAAMFESLGMSADTARRWRGASSRSIARPRSPRWRTGGAISRRQRRGLGS
jgi:pimeloyl-ACP methyl ester carboxylesterase